MRPAASSGAALNRMKLQARRDTQPEIQLRRELWRRGLRYRVDVAVLPGLRRRADIAFTRQRVAVFVDGCFWHACPKHATFPRSNKDWWAEKLNANVARDRDTDRRLRAAGWMVIRIWEHRDPGEAAEAIQQALSMNVCGWNGRHTGAP
jgi:DNA mismatch endonuclease (patch repair protein)